MNRVEFKTKVHDGIIEIPKGNAEIKDKNAEIPDLKRKFAKIEIESKKVELKVRIAELLRQAVKESTQTQYIITNYNKSRDNI